MKQQYANDEKVLWLRSLAQHLLKLQFVRSCDEIDDRVRKPSEIVVYEYLSKHIISTFFTYASETWTLFKSDETLFAALEGKMLRSILSPVCVEGQCRSRYYDEIYEMYRNLTVVHCIKLARLP